MTYFRIGLNRLHHTTGPDWDITVPCDMTPDQIEWAEWTKCWGDSRFGSCWTDEYSDFLASACGADFEMVNRLDLPTVDRMLSAA